MIKMTLNPWSWHFKRIFFSHWSRGLAALGLLLLSCGHLQATATVTTLGGGSTSRPYSGYLDGNTLSVAMFNTPAGMALDPSGTSLFIADYNNNAIRLVSQVGDTANSVTTTFANATNGAGISGPIAVTVDSATNVYVLNQGSGQVLHLSGVYMNSGLVLVYPPLASGLVNATAMAMDGYDNLYVTVNGNKVVRVSTNKVVTTIGTVSQAGTSLKGIAVLDNGQLALSDAGNNGVWIMNPVTGTSTKLTGFHGAGDVLGLSSSAAFNTPQTISKAAGGILVVADYGNHKVKLVDSTGTASLLYGVSSNLWVTGTGTFPGWWDGLGLPTQGSAESRLPYGVLVGPDGSVYATEDYYHVLRHVTGTGLAGPQPGYPQMFRAPGGIAFDPTGTSLYVADYTNNTIQLLNLGNNQTSVFLNSTNGIGHPSSVLVDTNSYVYVLNQNAGTNGCLLQFDNYGNFLGTNITGLNWPTALTMDGNGNIFIAEQTGGIKVLFPSGASNTIVTLNTNTPITVGTNIVALKTNVLLQGVAVFDDGFLAVSDAGNQVILTVNPLTKIVSKLTGQIGTNGTTLGASNFAKLYQPHQLARAGNNQLVIADYGNNRLVTATRAGSITNVLVSTNSQVWYGRPNDPYPGSSLPMLLPAGVAVSHSGLVFDSEPTNAAIRGLTGPIAAPPVPPIVTLPFFNAPQGIAFDSIGNYLFIADYANNAVQLLDLNANQTSTFLNTANGVLNPASVLVDTNENIYVLNQGVPGSGFIEEYDIYGNDYGPIVTGLNQPTAFTMDGNGSFFVTEQSSNILVALSSGVSNLVATVTNAGASLQGIALFDDGSIAVSDAGNHVIWTVNPITKLVTKLTGQLHTNGIAVGASNFAKLYQPHQLVRVGGNQIVVADYGNNRLVLVERNGTILTNSATYHLNSAVANIWFGQNGDPVAAGNAKFVPMIQPFGITVGNGGEIFASETYYDDIRGLTGTGLTSPSFNPGFPLPVYSSLAGIALNNLGTSLFIADPTNNTISKLNLANNQTTVFLDASSGIYQPVDVGLDSSDNLYVLNQGIGGNGSIMEFDQFGNFLGTNPASLSWPTAMKLNFSGDIYVSELNGAVRKFFAGGSNTTLVTITTNANVRLSGIAVLDNGSVVVSDAGNQVLWKLAPSATNVVLFTGVLGSPGTNFGGVGFAKLNKPMRLAQAFGGLLLIADSGNNRVVLANNLGTVSSALNSTNANLWFGLPIDPVAPGSPNFLPMVTPVGLAIGAGTNATVYVSENFYKDIRGILKTGLQAPIQPPPAPLNLVATASYGQVVLTWSAVNSATNYNVKRSPSSGGPYTLIGGTSTTTYTDTNVLNGSTYYYVVTAVNGGGESPFSNEASATALIPPPPAPRIGWYDYEGNEATGFFTVLHPVSIVTFNNDQLLAIDPYTNGVSTYYTTDGSIPSSTNGGTPPFYQDNLSTTYLLQPLPVPTGPDVVIKAISVNSDSNSSPITTAEFVFRVATPINIAPNTLDPFHIQLSCVTSNSTFYFTLDGSDPTTSPSSSIWYASDGPLKIDPSNFTNPTNGTATLKVVAERSGYYNSGIFQNVFNITNAVYDFAISPNSGYYPMGRLIQVTCPGTNVHYTMDGTEPTSNSPPVLNIVNHTGYIRWFSTTNDLTMLRVKAFFGGTNASPTTNGLPVPAANIGTPPDFNPSLQAGIGSTIVIPVVCNLAANQQIKSFQLRYEIAPVNNANTPVILALNIMPTNDFVPIKSAVLGGVMGSYSVQPYSLGLTNGLVITTGSNILFQGFAVVAMLEVQIPYSASVGDTYSLSVLFPSATSDGYSAGVPLTPMAPTTIVVTNLPYTVGDSASANGSWYNAGTFGDNNLDNSDVNQAFYAASGLRVPYSFTDVYNAMDAYPPDAPGFVGGDGQIRFLDWVTILQRSLRLDPANWAREWSAGGVLVGNATNLVIPHVMAAVASHDNTVSAPWYRQVLLGATSVGNAAPNSIVSVPLYAKLADGSTLSGMQFRAVVTPLNGAPALTTSPQLSLAGGVASPLLAKSFKSGETAFGWQPGSFNYLSRSSNFLGWVVFSVPTNAVTGQSYQVSLANADGSPDLTNQYDFETRSATVTVNAPAPPASICSDEWKIHFFGSTTNPAAADAADPDGDGVPNWIEFLTGTDPTSAQSKLQLGSAGMVASRNQKQMQLNWLTAPGRAYALQWSSNLVSGTWSTISTISGNGSVTNCADANSSDAARYYRLYVLP